jgi:hypothetical protein
LLAPLAIAEMPSNLLQQPELPVASICISSSASRYMKAAAIIKALWHMQLSCQAHFSCFYNFTVFAYLGASSHCNSLSQPLESIYRANKMNSNCYFLLPPL